MNEGRLNNGETKHLLKKKTTTKKLDQNTNVYNSIKNELSLKIKSIRTHFVI